MALYERTVTKLFRIRRSLKKIVVALVIREETVGSYIAEIRFLPTMTKD